MDSCFPLKLANRSINTKNPWFNLEAKKLNNLKYSLRQLAKIYPNLLPAYIISQKHYNHSIRSIKKNYYRNLFQKNKLNARKTWKTINNLTGRSKNKSSKPTTINHNTKTITDPNEVVNFLNHHFCTIGNSLNQNSQNPNYFTYNSTSQLNSFVLLDITEDEITKSIHNLKLNSSPGYDDITPKLLKITVPYISKVLLHIFNSSFKTGTFPSRMKTAKVVPIFKKGNRSDVNNYRPISLLPILSKCLEKIMHNRLTSYLVKNDIINHSQFGFTRNKSTTDAIIDFMHKFTHHTKNNLVLAIFCDLSKAFDCVNHAILLNKLHYIGIRGLPHKWFQSYLSNRKQFTTIAETVPSKSGHNSFLITHASNLEPLTRGVPQGSILGPLLFNIYINELPHSNPSIDNYILYADDTSIILSANDQASLELKLNSALFHTTSWLKANQLSLNLSKTNYMHLNSKSNANTLTVTANMSSNIQKIEQTKFLGLHISSDLTWNHHITQIIKKVRPGIAMLFKLKLTVDTKILLHIYYSLIHSHLNYAILIWGDAPLTHITKLLKLQKKAIRIILHKHRLVSCRPLFKKLAILTIPSIYILEASCFIKKLLLHHNTHLTIQTTGEIHEYHTRRQNHVYIPNSKHTKFDIKYKCSSIYNRLPEHLKALTSMQRFRLSTKKFLLDNTLYSINELSHHKHA